MLPLLGLPPFSIYLCGPVSSGVKMRALCWVLTGRGKKAAPLMGSRKSSCRTIKTNVGSQSMVRAKFTHETILTMWFAPRIQRSVEVIPKMTTSSAATYNIELRPITLAESFRAQYWRLVILDAI